MFSTQSEYSPAPMTPTNWVRWTISENASAGLSAMPKIRSPRTQPSWNEPMKPGADGTDTAMATRVVITSAPRSAGTSMWKAQKPST